jgi:hypothetical protein
VTAKQALEEVLRHLPESRLGELLDFARFLSWREEREGWQQFGRGQLAKAYGPDEPEYTLDEIKPGLNG